ncbi:MAG: hypothetical protein FVQ80_06700 [Planctomycetes bacterium]|nr:hypothetical protein [Planctomycetota bacterium]
MRGLNKKLVARLVERNVVVAFEIDYGVSVTCYLRSRVGGNYTIASGFAICSTTEKFEESAGKNKAAGRALKALINQTHGEVVRSHWDDFPKSWSKRQIDRVLKSGTLYKSWYRAGTGT